MQTKSKAGERIVVISLRDGNTKYLSGHVVGGRNLFPAMGYLVSSRIQYLTDALWAFHILM
jgi:fatty acid synthase